MNNNNNLETLDFLKVEKGYENVTPDNNIAKPVEPTATLVTNPDELNIPKDEIDSIPVLDLSALMETSNESNNNQENKDNTASNPPLEPVLPTNDTQTSSAVNNATGTDTTLNSGNATIMMQQMPQSSNGENPPKENTNKKGKGGIIFLSILVIIILVVCFCYFIILKPKNIMLKTTNTVLNSMSAEIKNNSDDIKIKSFSNSGTIELEDLGQKISLDYKINSDLENKILKISSSLFGLNELLLTDNKNIYYQNNKIPNKVLSEKLPESFDIVSELVKSNLSKEDIFHILEVSKKAIIDNMDDDRLSKTLEFGKVNGSTTLLMNINYTVDDTEYKKIKTNIFKAFSEDKQILSLLSKMLNLNEEIVKELLKYDSEKDTVTYEVVEFVISLDVLHQKLYSITMIANEYQLEYIDEVVSKFTFKTIDENVSLMITYNKGTKESNLNVKIGAYTFDINILFENVTDTSNDMTITIKTGSELNNSTYVIKCKTTINEEFKGIDTAKSQPISSLTKEEKEILSSSFLWEFISNFFPEEESDSQKQKLIQQM